MKNKYQHNEIWRGLIHKHGFDRVFFHYRWIAKILTTQKERHDKPENRENN